ncbi:hypothetical protein GBAR_LOCUS18408 [Geodia barretti]|uniref:Uncharacterized protein n=1 Tax=Geodia barretti TaxID=519541 RepID=A0AA35SNW1_GEOBA|nr:hypothetical protein GBAR_LOCUS18408 [Geodia barretti]
MICSRFKKNCGMQGPSGGTLDWGSRSERPIYGLSTRTGITSTINFRA